MLLKAPIRLIKWLICTNIYIALAAVCFQGVICLIDPVLYNEPWNVALTANIFFSTLLVYQFSRFNFHKNYQVSPDAQKDLIYQFVDSNPIYSKVSIAIGLIGSIISVCFLRINTISFMLVLGLVAMIYPMKIGSFKLRSIPFIKIFLIAFIWASMAIFLPHLESQHAPWTYYIPHFIFLFTFILFITLPFDMNDISVDKKTGVKTIPSVLGLQQTKNLIILLAAVLSLLAFFILDDYLLIGCLILFFIALTSISISKAATLKKWQVMAIYDGSMIILFLIFLVLKQFSNLIA